MSVLCCPVFFTHQCLGLSPLVFITRLNHVLLLGCLWSENLNSFHTLAAGAWFGTLRIQRNAMCRWEKCLISSPTTFKFSLLAQYPAGLVLFYSWQAANIIESTLPCRVLLSINKVVGHEIPDQTPIGNQLPPKVCVSFNIFTPSFLCCLQFLAETNFRSSWHPADHHFSFFVCSAFTAHYTRCGSVWFRLSSRFFIISYCSFLQASQENVKAWEALIPDHTPKTGKEDATGQRKRCCALWRLKHLCV